MYDGMKVFCSRCMFYVLVTSDKFKVGGPYNGSMFKIPEDKPDAANYFPFDEWVTEGNLLCPYCDQEFVTPDGNLLTEHGLVRPEQKTIERSVSVIYPDNVLMSDSTFSLEVGQKVETEEEPPVEPVVEEEVAEPEEEVEEPEPEEEEAFPDVEVESEVDAKPDTFYPYTCKKCGKSLRYPSEHRKGCD